MVVALREEVHPASTYLKYLPSFYSESDFMGRFLLIFESVLGPLEDLVDNLAFYFDPGTTPEEFLGWLASWLGVTLDPLRPLPERRELVRSSGRLFQWRGTRRGLTEYLRLATGCQVRIVEHFGGILVADRSRLGRNTILGEGEPHTFTVYLEMDDPARVILEQVRAIIEREKPAHTAYRLEVVPPGGATEDEIGDA